jgi:death on curing protein
MRWLEQQTVIAIHQRQLAEHGGSPGVRDSGLLASALARPRHQHLYGEGLDAADFAAAYAFGIAKNHPFVDGNKRVALVVLRTFLLLNGYDLRASQEEKYLTILQLAEGSLTENELAIWIRERIIKLER